jgi:thiol:disulfide interchange protein DsbD
MRSILFKCLSRSAVLYAWGFIKLIVLLGGSLTSFFSFASEDFLQSKQSVVQLEEREPEFLPVSEAFVLSLSYKNPNIVEASWKIEEGYYLYRHQFKVLADSNAIQIGSLEIAPGIRKVDEWFGEVEVYYSQASLSFEILGASEGEASDFNLTFQGCADAGLCYPPVTRRFSLEGSDFIEWSNITKKPSAIEKREEQKLADALLKESAMWSLFLFFLGGIALAFTPCVFPMIPILSSIIVGEGENISRYRAFSLSGTYVIGMAITYAIIGTLVGVFGAQLNLQAALQTAPVLIFSASLFIALSLSMFGFYELQLPLSWQNKLNELSNLQSGGKHLSVFVMGAISSLVVSPCISAPLVGGLLYISQTQDAVLGGAALLSLGLGMGVPLLAIGMSGSYWLPRAGVWMEQIKGIFGFLLIGVAVWLIERLVSDTVNLIMWGFLLIGAAIYFGTLELRQRSAVEKTIQFVGVIAMLWGASLIIGSGLGGRSVFDPFEGVRNLSGDRPVRILNQWETVKTLSEVRDFIASSDKPVILDVYADWCISCKVMEQKVFTEPRVSGQLKAFDLLRVDVTQNDELDRELLTYLGFFGPPTLAFFSTDGIEMKEVRIQGEVESDDFSTHLKGVLSLNL